MVNTLCEIEMLESHVTRLFEKLIRYTFNVAVHYYVQSFRVETHCELV
jgi:hypothetical protein